MTFMSLLQYAYVQHDITTGTMILEEAIEKTRGYGSTGVEYNLIEEAYEQVGNPRLWLGNYEMSLEVKDDVVSGSASAGNWKLEIDRTRFSPGRVLRQLECLNALQREEEQNDGGA